MSPDPAQDLASRTGFDREFLGITIPLPSLTADIAHDTVDVDGSPILNYEHFSLAMSAERRMARWVAWNIDGNALIEEGLLSRDGLDFKRDPRLSRRQQILGDVYHKNILDRGHIARRADLLWGSIEEATRANADSFFFTNITPQAADFNQSSREGLWGRLENALLGQTDVTNNRVSVFGGPILSAGDRAYKSIQVPQEFWKLFVYVLDGSPRAKAFVLAQTLTGLERRIELPEWSTYERSLGELAGRTSLEFPSVREWGAALPKAYLEARRPVRDLDDIVW